MLWVERHGVVLMLDVGGPGGELQVKRPAHHIDCSQDVEFDLFILLHLLSVDHRLVALAVRITIHLSPFVQHVVDDDATLINEVCPVEEGEVPHTHAVQNVSAVTLVVLELLRH